MWNSDFRRKISALVWGASLLLSYLSLTGCSGRTTPASRATVVDLSERFSPAASVSPDSLIPHMGIMRRGERNDSLVLIAPATVRALLDGVRGKWKLQGLAAPVFNIGDGIQMSIRLRRDGAQIAAGGRYFDPGRKAEDRSWIPISIPLEIRAGDQLEIEVGGGPQGDLVADWLALSSLRLTPDTSRF